MDRRLRGAPAAGVLALLLAGPCGLFGGGPAAAQEVGGDRAATGREVVADATTPTGTSVAALTPEAGDAYRFAPSPATMRVTADGSNRGTNLRLVWWPSHAPATVDGEGCATWTRANDRLAQPGIALRIRTDGARVRALTVTNNILFAGRWGWNVHGWDSADPGVHRLGWAALTQVFGDRVEELPLLPWRVCARVVEARLELKAWPARPGVAEPAWGDARHGTAVALPSRWVFPGRTGWYVGHLSPGEVSTFEGLGTWALRGSAADRHHQAVGGWVADLYPLLFGRPADAGRAHWADQAVLRGPQWVVAAMGVTAEARAKTVTEVYQQVLRRDPEPAGRDYWAERLRLQPNVESLTLSVLLSPELSGPRDDEAFVEALYDRILGRAAAPVDVEHWAARLGAGETRASVASRFVRSPENRTATVRRLHAEVVGRAPTEGELRWWSEGFVALGLDRLRLRAALAAALYPPP